MRYIKVFELFNSTGVSFELEEKSYDKLVYNFKVKYKYKVIFNLTEISNLKVWDCRYILDTAISNKKYTLTKDNPFTIAATGDSIMRDFIEKVNPEIIHIQHIGEETELLKNSKTYFNKRSKLHYKYMNNLSYHCLYFYENKKILDTVCVLYKNTNMKDEIISNYGEDNYKLID